MKPVKVLVLILLAIGLIEYNLSVTQADPTSVDTKPIDTNGKDIADIKAVEDQFITCGSLTASKRLTEDGSLPIHTFLSQLICGRAKPTWNQIPEQASRLQSRQETRENPQVIIVPGAPGDHGVPAR
jgi:hypothetical protein